MKNITFIFIAAFFFCSRGFCSPKTYDLTKLGSNMMYAQVYNMIMEADQFNGARIKMNGIFYENTDINKGPLYQCILVKDGTGCCTAGFDIQKADSSVKFPKHMTDIYVEGIFVVKEGADGITRSFLLIDKLSVL